MSSALIKEAYQGIDTGFDASYDWGSPSPSKPVSRPDKTMSPEQALWLSVLNEAWVDALKVPRDLVCGAEAKAKVMHIEKWLAADEKSKAISHLRNFPEDAKTDPYYRECQVLYGHPSHADYKKASDKVREIGRPPYHRDQIEYLRAWLWITEQHPSFKTACALSGCDPDGVSDGIYRAVTGRKRGRPRLVRVGPVG